MLNKIVLMGRLTRDPELRRTQQGTAVASFSLAVDPDYKAKVVADNIYFGDSKKDGNSGNGNYGAADYGGGYEGGSYESGDFHEVSEEEGELPF